jgi:hypothetical protein
MSKFSGKLGAGFCESEKPVILWDDFQGTYREFDTIQEAVDAREKESYSDQWAALKMIFLYNSAKSEYETQTVESINRTISSIVQT